jgi:hypothetical protein
MMMAVMIVMTGMEEVVVHLLEQEGRSHLPVSCVVPEICLFNRFPLSLF